MTGHRSAAVRWLRPALAVVVLATAGACSPSTSDDIASFALEYATGSIPPPGNYTYRVDGTVRDDGDLELVYTLTYRFRDELTDDELEAQGYGPDDDLTWTTVVSGADADAWLDLATATDVGEAQGMPGSDSITVTVRFSSGEERSGEPDNRDDWEAAADALDLDARQALGHPRASR
jgi:hypothetical protein